MIKYKGYIGLVEYDDEAGVFHGKVINISDTVTFEGESVAEIRQAFQDSVEDYLAFCKKLGKEANKPFSGEFRLRLDPALHRRVAIAAKMAGKSLNSWVSEKLDQASKDVG